MATSTEMSLLRSCAALVNPSQRKRLMSCLKMETRTTMACWTLMVWWFINYISFYLWECMNSDQVLKQHPCLFSPRIPQDDGECAVKQRLKDIPLPSHPCQQEPLPLSATQIHFPLLSSFCLHLTSSADTDKHLCGVCQGWVPTEPSCKIQGAKLWCGSQAHHVMMTLKFARSTCHGRPHVCECLV